MRTPGGPAARRRRSPGARLHHLACAVRAAAAAPADLLLARTSLPLGKPWPGLIAEPVATNPVSEDEPTCGCRLRELPHAAHRRHAPCRKLALRVAARSRQKEVKTRRIATCPTEFIDERPWGSLPFLGRERRDPPRMTVVHLDPDAACASQAAHGRPVGAEARDSIPPEIPIGAPPRGNGRTDRRRDVHVNPSRPGLAKRTRHVKELHRLCKAGRERIGIRWRYPAIPDSWCAGIRRHRRELVNADGMRGRTLDGRPESGGHGFSTEPVQIALVDLAEAATPVVRTEETTARRLLAKGTPAAAEAGAAIRRMDDFPHRRVDVVEEETRPGMEPGEP